MKKIARDLSKGDKIKIAGQVCVVDFVEISDIGKQGTRKVRIIAITPAGEKITVIRPEDYPFEQ